MNPMYVLLVLAPQPSTGELTSTLSVLSAMITPTVLILACGSLILTTSQRLTRVIDRVFDDYSTYAAVPHKFEAGTPNAGGAVGLAAAMDYLDSVGHEAMWAHEQMLTSYGMEALARVDGLRMYGPRNPEERTAVFSFEIEGLHPHDIATVLDSQGIAIRAGHHCAQPLMRRLAVPATTRASCYLYNTTGEIDRLIDGLEMAKSLFL